MFEGLKPGSRKGWPAGWSQPAPVYNRRTGVYEHFPPVWIKGRPATNKDINALFGYYGRTVDYDHYSIRGKRSPNYSTAKIEAVKNGGPRTYGWWRFMLK